MDKLVNRSDRPGYTDTQDEDSVYCDIVDPAHQVDTSRISQIAGSGEYASASNVLGHQSLGSEKRDTDNNQPGEYDDVEAPRTYQSLINVKKTDSKSKNEAPSDANDIKPVDCQQLHAPPPNAPNLEAPNNAPSQAPIINQTNQQSPAYPAPQYPGNQYGPPPAYNNPAYTPGYQPPPPGNQTPGYQPPPPGNQTPGYQPPPPGNQTPNTTVITYNPQTQQMVTHNPGQPGVYQQGNTTIITQAPPPPSENSQEYSCQLVCNLVLAILVMVICCNWLCGIPATVTSALGLQSRKKSFRKNMTIWSWVLNIVAILAVIITVVSVTMVFVNASNSYTRRYYYYSCTYYYTDSLGFLAVGYKTCTSYYK